MTPNLNPDSIRKAAQRALDDRIELVPSLLRAQEASELAKSAALDVERAHAAAWSAAVNGGWTPAELRKLGLTDPGRKTPGRPRRSKQNKPASPLSDPTLHAAATISENSADSE